MTAGKFLPCFPSPSAARTTIACVKQRDSLEEVGVADAGDDTGVRICRTESVCKASMASSSLLSSLNQSFRNSWPEAAYIAVTSSKASSGFPPVFTFSKTTHTASLDVDRSRLMTGTR